MQTITPKSSKIDSSRLPTALTSKPQWVLWKLQIDTNQRSKPRKLPVQTSLRPASVTDPSTWCDFTTAIDAIERLGRKADIGLGFVFTCDGLCGIDMDNVVSESGEIHPQAQELLDRIPGYKELSPSGRGLHIITLGTPPWTGRRDCGISVEVYTDRRFFTITTDTLPGSHMLDRPTDLSPLEAFDQTRHVSPAANEDAWAYMKGPDPQWTVERVQSLLDKLPDFPYPDWLKVGYALHHQFDGSEDGYELFQNYSERGERYTGEADTRRLWNSIRASANRPPVTIATLVHMRNVQKGLNHSVENKLPPEPLFVRLKDAKREIRSTQWAIERFVKKESLIMIAGAPGSGKTYVALDMALSIATGKPWLDTYKTQQGAVILVACEGRDSLLRRVCSWEALKNAGEDVEDAFVTNAEIVVGTSPDAPNSSEALARFTEQMGVQPALIVMDTMNFTLGTCNENDSNLMTDYFSTLSRNLIRKFKCAVVLVHHTNKGKSDIRGSTAIRGALDALYLVEKRGNQYVVSNDKHKDCDADQIETLYLNQQAVEITLADGRSESNIALFRGFQVTSKSSLSNAQQTLVDTMAKLVGVGSRIDKKLLRERLGVPSANWARSYVNPLKTLGYLEEPDSKTLVLLKTGDTADDEFRA